MISLLRERMSSNLSRKYRSINRSIISLIEDDPASPRKQWFLVKNITNMMFRTTRDNESNDDIGIHCDLANQCEDITLRIEVFAFVESVDDDYSRVKRVRKECEWFNDEAFQLDSSGPLGEGKVLHHGPINIPVYVRCKLVGKGGK